MNRGYQKRELLKILGKKCRLIRKSLHISQQEFGKKAGFSQANISSFERGYRDSVYILREYYVLYFSNQEYLFDIDVSDIKAALFI